MIKRLSVLNGLAILAVVIAHAGWIGHEVMTLWTNPNLPDPIPHWDQLGSFPYYALLAIRQLPAFSVPSFLFISGFFVAYTFQGTQISSSRKIIIKRLITLLIPYLIYSFIIIIGGLILGKKTTLIDYLITLISKGVIGPYWYIPVLSYFYLLSLVIAPFARSHWKSLLTLSAVIQLIAMSYYYLYLSGVNILGSQQLGLFFPYSHSVQTIFFFTFGMVFCFNIQKFKEFLIPLKRFFVIALPVLGLINIIESDILIRATKSIFSPAYLGTISFNLFALTFIGWFITLDNVPQLNRISWIGRKSYGIYLLHSIFMYGAAKFLFQLTPQIPNNQLFFIPLLIGIGLVIPLIIMIFFEKTPAHRFYHIFFG